MPAPVPPIVRRLCDLLMARCGQSERRVEERRHVPGRRAEDRLPPESGLMPVHPPDDYHPALPQPELDRRQHDRRRTYTGPERRR
jgi:hypothetical protein